MAIKLSATEKGLGRWKTNKDVSESDDTETATGKQHPEKPKSLGMLRLVKSDGTVVIIKNYDDDGNYHFVDFKVEKEKFLKEEDKKKKL